MDLTNYWKALAAPEAYGKECRFFNNGFFAIATEKKSYWNIFDPKGRLFMYANIGDGHFKVLGNGIMAVKAAEGWTFINPDKSVFLRLYRKNAEILDYHSFIVKDDNGATFLYWLETPEDGYELGFGIEEVKDSPGTAFAYKRRLRHNIYWHLANTETAMDKSLRLAKDVCFFANGSYAVERQDILSLFNRRNEKVFGLKMSTTYYAPVSNLYFYAYSICSAAGTYSTETGKRITPKKMDFLSENGFYYAKGEEIVLVNAETIADCGFSDAGLFANGLFFLRYKGCYFVFDATMSKAEMRAKIKNAIMPCTEVLDYLSTLAFLLN